MDLLIERKKLVAQYNELNAAAALNRNQQIKAENATENISCRGTTDSKNESDEAVLAASKRMDESKKCEQRCTCESADLSFILYCTYTPLTEHVQ